MRQSHRTRCAWHMLALVAFAACADENAEAPREAGLTSEELGSGWTKLPDPPLSGRSNALVVTVGDTIVVSGGWEWLCPPGADCVGPRTPPYADGAAYDLNTGSWRTIADAPAGFVRGASAVIGHDVYALAQCGSGTCPAGRALLRYRSDADAWDMLPAPDQMGDYSLVAVRDGVVAYRRSDEGGSTPDYRFIPDQDRWEALPDDPLPPVYDRFVVAYDERLMVFGTPIARDAAKTKLAAVYDPQSDAWQELAESETQGYQVWRAGPLLYLNPHFGRGGGGIYDPTANAWRPLPDPPHHDLAGIITEDGSAYEYSSGWVRDTRAGRWLEIEPRPDAEEVYDEVVAEAPNRGMVVFGGQSWAGGRGELVAHTWLWSPPPTAR
jgi:hypothetical protein